MSAEVIQFANFRARKQFVHAGSDLTATAKVASGFDAPTRFHFWTGATGKRYVHTVYSLFDCPPVGMANYVLVRKEGGAKRTVLAIGRVTGDSLSLNLAEIRQRGASLGADEVHIHLLASSAHESQAVEVDLRTAQFAARAT
ncbi:MAG TPA: hypothetical protein PKD49_08640 [Hyphomicrobium sp.]|nr:hypothetical protein [Hyphomicrobium sp.]